MKKIFLPILILAAILPTACSGTNTPAPTTQPAAEEISFNSVTAEGTLLPTPSVELAFAQGGVVTEISAFPGDHVAAGDVIVQLIGIETAQAELAAAQLEQTLAQQALDTLNRDALLISTQTEQALLKSQKAYESEANGWSIGNKDAASDLELAIDDYVTIEEDYRNAREKLDSLLYKDESNRERRDAQKDFNNEKESQTEAYADLLVAVSENDQSLDQELTNLLTAIANLEISRELQARLNNTNLDPESLAAADARLKAANAHVHAAEAAVELYELHAPFNGVLLSLDLAIGESVTPTFPVAFLADTSRWVVETKDFAEVDMANVSIGDLTIVKLDAFPGEEFTGTVTEIDPVGREYLGDMTYKITIMLNETDPRFFWNMTATVRIEIK